jgi:hypothetical protein
MRDDEETVIPGRVVPDVFLQEAFHKLDLVVEQAAPKECIFYLEGLYSGKWRGEQHILENLYVTT